MTYIKQYVISVICSAIVCSIVSGLVKDSCNSKIIKLLCSVFLIIQILKPIPSISKLSFSNWYPTIIQDAVYYADEGEILARQQTEEVIINKTESYILSKAAVQDPNFHVQIKLSSGDNPVPESVIISGNLTTTEKNELQQLLESDLAVTRENQVWIGGE